MTQNQVIRHMLVRDTLWAARYFFSRNYGKKMIVAECHKRICDEFDLVFAGVVVNLMINVFPRSGKTELLIAKILKGLALNARARYIIISYSDNLICKISEQIKTAVESDWYQELFPWVKIKKGSSAKDQWYTTEGGGVYAVSSQGQITGFGAGLSKTEDSDIRSFLDGEDDNFVDSDYEPINPEWGGAIMIDDPIKVLDADSSVVRERVIDIFKGTVLSRKNDRNTPIIIIMQRLHKDDLCGHLIKTEGDKWKVVSLPALIEDEHGNKRSLYPEKFTVAELEDMKVKRPSVYNTQYQQKPTEKNEKMWLHAFDRKRNVGKTTYNPKLPLYVSFDFNRDPMTCSMWQITSNCVYGIDTIKLSNATTRMVCQEIEKRYPSALLIITGDCSGNQRTTMSLLNNYEEIRMFFRLGRSSIQVSASNPRLAESRIFMNSVFERYNIVVDEERCKPLIFDFEEVQADADNKPLKDNRNDETQRSDFLDNARYFFHQFYNLFADYAN